MERREFLKKSVVAAGLVGTLKVLEPIAADGSPPANSAPAPVPGTATQADNRSAEYLRKAQGEPFLPKPPVVAEGSGTLKLSPMTLADRIKQKIVPQRGLCSLAPRQRRPSVWQWSRKHGVGG